MMHSRQWRFSLYTCTWVPSAQMNSSQTEKIMYSLNVIIINLLVAEKVCPVNHTCPHCSHHQHYLGNNVCFHVWAFEFNFMMFVDHTSKCHMHIFKKKQAVFFEPHTLVLQCVIQLKSSFNISRCSIIWEQTCWFE